MKSRGADISAGVSGPNLKLEYDQDQNRHSAYNARRSDHYHSVVVGKTDSGAMKMTRRVGQKDNNEESDEKL
jgi:hypothetical protein